MLPTSLNQINQTPNHSPANARQRNTPLAALPNRPGLALLMVFVLLALATASLRATIPAAAKADPRFGLGYLVVTYYPGVTTNDSGDCTAGIQAAINDASAINQAFGALQLWRCSTNLVAPVRPLAVFFPPGTYRVSDTLQCYQWWDTNRCLGAYHTVLGSTAGASRPLIKLAAGAAKYQNSSAPRPIIAFNGWLQQPGGPYPPVTVTDPMNAPRGYKDEPGYDMTAGLRNFDFDCNSNPGAIGVVMSGAQNVSIENVKVLATNAFAGFCELPGAGGVAANLEAAGGQYGVIQGSRFYGDLPGMGLQSTAGPVVAGLTLENQTVAAILYGELCSPMTVAGFKITNSQGIRISNYPWATSYGVLTMMDGQIGINNAANPAAIDNRAAGKDLYLRNVYISGTTNLVKSGAYVTTGSGTWSYLAEYAYNDEDYWAETDDNYRQGLINSYSLINGIVKNWITPFPISPKLTTNSGPPPADLVSRHLWQSYPSYNGAANDPLTVVVSTNLGCNNFNDSTVALQTSIDLASTNPAYGGRVFLPAGIYYITNTLTLHTNTVLLGVGRSMSCIQAAQAWRPTSNVTVIRTEDSATATTTLAYLSVTSRYINYPDSETNYSRFNIITWQAGANSLVVGVAPMDPWTVYPTCWPRSVLIFTNHGGGKWYGLVVGRYGESNPAFRRVKLVGTTQPLWFYSLNMESGPSDVDGEMTGAANVRILGMKREGGGNEWVISNSTNIAAYGYGWGGTDGGPSSSLYQVLGTSTNVLLGNLAAGGGYLSTGNTVYEALTGLPVTNVLWPKHISLYKRGEINDTNMFVVVGGSPPAVPSNLTADAVSSSQINLAWNDVGYELGYKLERKTNGGSYSQIASPGRQCGELHRHGPECRHDVLLPGGGHQ